MQNERCWRSKLKKDATCLKHMAPYTTVKTLEATLVLAGNDSIRRHARRYPHHDIAKAGPRFAQLLGH
eukprot:9376544-Pyramimonas_sp.AAC.1